MFERDNNSIPLQLSKNVNLTKVHICKKMFSYAGTEPALNAELHVARQNEKDKASSQLRAISLTVIVNGNQCH